uniref:Uncharacterized protein n=1 Tax=Arundo donax TaxID=35708 RepID=A0A0A9A9H4_ARUDO
MHSIANGHSALHSPFCTAPRRQWHTPCLPFSQHRTQASF